MIFRARDKNAAPMIAFYRKLCTDPHHKEIVGERLHHFVDFILQHPERIKEPDTGLDVEIQVHTDISDRLERAGK